MRSVEKSDEAVQRAPSAGDDEVAIVRRAQMGSAAAFEQLVAEYAPDLHRYLVIRLRDESDARDALQEVLIAAWQSLPTLKEPGRFWPWLVAITAHKATDVMRRRRPTSELSDVASRPDDDTFAIRDALDRLAPRFREVLLLRYGLQLSEREVADVLGVRIGTVKSRSARARKALEELLR